MIRPNDMFNAVAPLLLAAILLPAFTPRVAAQSIDLSGYVKAEAAYDTRQVLQVREGQLHLYPLPDAPDAEADNLLLNAFQSRLAVTGSGTEALGAALTGVVEADFFGVSNADVNGLRLRHAFVKLDWGRHEVLAGQYWSPFFSPSVLPGVQSGSAGAPFQPFARLTQLRYTWKPGALNVLAALSQQRDAFSSIGGAKSQQQAGRPGLHLHAEYGAQAGHLVGIGLYAKQLRPARTGARLTTWAAQGYARLSTGAMRVRAKATYGSDLTDHLMTGGFVQTLEGRYEGLRAASAWVDVETEGPSAFRTGIFAGYATNRGAGRSLASEGLAKTAAAITLGAVGLRSEHTRAFNIDHVWRLAPRVVYATGQLVLSAELEVTSALYAGSSDERLRPRSADGDEPVTNVRTLLSAFYFF